MAISYYKYRQVSFDKNGDLSKESLNYVINPIKTSHYYLPTRDRLNDPTEGVFNNQIQSELLGFMQGVPGLGERQELAEPIFEHARALSTAIDSSGIFSLTHNHTDELMWAHYADSHRGIAIEYDLDLLTRFTPRAHLHTFDVEYEKKPPKLGLRDINNSKVLQVMLGYKSPRWAYEEEFRVLVDNINGQIPHDYRAVKSITFGLNFPIEKRQVIIDLVSNKVTNFYEIKKIPNSYMFERVEYQKIASRAAKVDNPQIDWNFHLSGTTPSEKAALIEQVESIIKLDPHYLELIQAEKSSIQNGKYCIQYQTTHKMGLTVSTEYTKIYL